MNFIQIPSGLKAHSIQSFDEPGAAAKAKFHREGRAFLKLLAKTLGSIGPEYVMSSNYAGPAVSGEVTLHSESLFIQLSESCSSLGRGIGMLYCSCKGKTDYTGGTNHWVDLCEFEDPQRQDEVLAEMRALVACNAVAALAA